MTATRNWFGIYYGWIVVGVAALTMLVASGLRSAPGVFLLPAEVALQPRSAVAREFGEPFVDEVLKAGTGAWTGPIRSGYGLHLVLVREREESRVARLAEVRAQV